MQEKRRAVRVKFKGLVHCEQLEERDFSNIEMLGRTLDISEVGILLETQHVFPLRTELNLAIALGDEIIDVRARVTRLADVEDGTIRMGVEFSDISEADKGIIRRYVQEEEGKEEP